MPLTLNSPEQSAAPRLLEHAKFHPGNRNDRRVEKGEVVEVLPWNEIVRTLDENGSLDGLPFMPEMLPYCGRKLTVTQRLERTCEELEGGMRRIRSVVFLNDLRCDGSAHGGCQKGCCFLWKDAWLRRPVEAMEENDGGPPVYPFPCSFDDQRYMCQSTELLRATSPISALDVASYFRDLRARTYGAAELLRIVYRAASHRIRCRLSHKSHRVLEGTCIQTTRRTLNLMPGEWVRVKSAEQIAETVNKRGKNRGLAFTVEMLPFCGRTFRVLRRLEKMIDERTGKLISLEGTVILENVICDGCHILRGGCPKQNYHYWREVWLERV